MAIASFKFFAFALIVIVLYNLAAARNWRRSVLIVANVLFLASFSLSLLTFLPLIGFLAWGYINLWLIGSQRKHLALVPLVVGTIAIFVWLKKYSFLPGYAFLPFPYLTIGLSYIFFRVLHLLIDARDGNLPFPIGIVDYLNYTLNFTTLVSGPIQWYQHFAAMQLEAGCMPLNVVIAAEAVERIIVGLFKVVVLSMIFSSAQQHALSSLTSSQTFAFRIGAAAVVFVAYPFHLYCNFSGYTDIVIGVARFLRLRLPENFDRPFSSLNFLGFWSRWHITLSAWLKTYVYNPLLKALMKRFPSAKVEPFLGVFAFFVTFFLVGVWHGQTSVFLFFGVLQGAGVSVNKLSQVLMARYLGRREYKSLAANWIYQSFSRGLTFTFFAFTLLWFWSNWTQLASIVHTLGWTPVISAWIAIFLAATILLATYESIRAWALSLAFSDAPILVSRYVRTVWTTALAVLTISTAIILNSPAPDIVYKSF